MKHLFTALMATIIAFNSFAQANNASGDNDPRATAILDKVSAKYKTFNTIRASFILVIESPEEGLNEEQAGTVYLKGEKYKLDFAGQQIICDNKTIWTYLQDANEVQINMYEPEEDAITPSKLFTLYEDGFLYRLNGEQTVNGKPASLIEMTPIDKDKPYFKINMLIAKSDNSIQEMKVFDRNGNRYTYKITKFASNLELGDNYFKFDPSKYDGIEAVDLR